MIEETAEQLEPPDAWILGSIRTSIAPIQQQVAAELPSNSS
jgi:hypothetical protein